MGFAALNPSYMLRFLLSPPTPNASGADAVAGSGFTHAPSTWSVIMIKLLVERDRPPTFDLANDAEVARHCRISVNAIAELAGRYYWLCTYATQEKLFSIIVVEDESVYDE